MSPEIRPTTAADLPAVLDILNHHIRHSTAIYSETLWNITQLEEWLAAKGRDGMPVLVSHSNGRVTGYGTYGIFRPKEGYRFCVEHSVYIAPDAQGQGIGTAMMRALIDRAEAQGMHTMVAGIDAANRASIDFHRKFGFVEAGLLREVGFKFGRWLDLQFMQLRLVHEG